MRPTPSAPRGRSRAAFIGALVQLLQARSFADITAQDIIALSTYSRASFYRHFQDKYDLAEQMVADEAREYAHLLGAQMRRCSALPTQEEYVYQLALEVFRHVAGRKALYRVILDAKADGLGADRFCLFALGFFKQGGWFAPDPSKSPIDPDFYYDCTTHQFFHYICYWGQHGFARPPEYMAAQVAEMARLAQPGAFLSSTANNKNRQA